MHYLRVDKFMLLLVIAVLTLSKFVSVQDSTTADSPNTFRVIAKALKMSSISLHVLSQPVSKIRDSFVK